MKRFGWDDWMEHVSDRINPLEYELFSRCSYLMNRDHDIILIEVCQSKVDKHGLDFLYMKGNYNSLKHVYKYIRVNVITDEQLDWEGKSAQYTDAEGKVWY